MLERGTAHPREYVFAEEGASVLRPEPDWLACIRSRDYKLVFFPGGRTGQLFDLRDDPGETRNRWADPACLEVRHRLTASLLDHLCDDTYRHRAT